MPLFSARALLIAVALAPVAPASASAAACTSERAAQSLPLGSAAPVVRLLAHHGVKVDEVCRDRRGLRLYASFAADPRSGPNTGFYNALLSRVAALVGEPRVTLIDRDDGVAIAVERDAAGDLSLDYALWPPRS